MSKSKGIKWNSKADLNQEMKNPEFKAAWDELDEEFAIINAMIEARKRSKMTQKEIAERMGTTASAVSRMFSSKHHLRVDTVASFLHANGFKIKKLVIEPVSKA